MTIGPIAFLAPWLLGALVVLPVLWWLLRAVPPAPARRRFPGVRLLLGLRDAERMPERTPWWLLLLRMVALAAAFVAFAEPVLNPERPGAGGPLLVVVDGGWGDAPEWTARSSRIVGALDDAARDGRPVAVVSLAARPPAERTLPLRPAQDWTGRLAGLAPRAWGPDRAAWAGWIAGLEPGGFETLWLTDGIGDGGETALAAALLDRGRVTVIGPRADALALTPPRLDGGALVVTAVRPAAGAARPVGVVAIGPDPNGIERALGTAAGSFAAEETAVDLAFDLPVELRNRVERVALTEGRSAGGVALADDSVRRRKVGLMAGGSGGEAQELIDPMHYLRNALEPFAELIEAPLSDMLAAAPDVLVLADVGDLGEDERAALTGWVEAGGLMIRFAGPRLAASGAGQLDADPLLPVRLRAGGRSVGGAMSWGAPRSLQPFPEASPFVGLDVPEEVEITAQVMAQPDPDLPDRVLASLDDGTPLVTGAGLGHGRVVLFHVTANADWSNLPLSGLFVRMLERLTQSAGGMAGGAATLDGGVWTPVVVLNGFGDVEAPTLIAGVAGDRLAAEPPSEEMPPGVYANGERRVALNVMRSGQALAPLAPLPDGVVVEALERPRETALGPWLLALALGLLAVDVLATLLLSGRLGRAARAAAAIAALALVLPGQGHAQTGEAQTGEAQTGDVRSGDAEAVLAANETVLAYVQTGNARVDAVSRAGLVGLSAALFTRTAVEPGEPVAVDLERDELALYPFLYWPIVEGQATPSAAAYARLNDYMRLGGMILFDTQDSQLGGALGASTPNGRVLQRIALRLDVPPLEQVPADHVLTRTFYLLQDYPGRYMAAPVWVEAAANAEEVEGLPFRNLNDGVSPVVIGGNDWAAAWAVDEDGQPAFPVGRGISGERQREMALRFGVNLIMYVMTGNYKSDQVHVPALLERLGQ
ncbi:DUF4159 domain-containing protein [Amaricoccus sp.]|uniref:DUF4159 domain-containing protein n=1 Tax=Amaricoccus sp. TaxID=1872485 RepID=UPI001B6A96BC|nr:DUF4159 domain-containing protein [Amaricoccus sp.]MBP7241344.1 DUF4159 domain-containing protein [Amaricoccus sp.]